MTALRRSTVLVVAASLTLITVGTVIGSGLGSSVAAAAAASQPRSPASLGARTTSGALPQPQPARAGAEWLAAQQSPQGFIPTAPGSGVPSLSSTAQTILALSAANVDPQGASLALSYMKSNIDSYVTVDGADGPGQLALLVLDAEALGVDPTTFGGTNLVSRLLATQQTTGADAGLFGTETQLADDYTGTYQQGLALVSLAAAGVRGTSQIHAADSWLVGQQCPDGGWTLPDVALNSCDGTPADFSGPDTNSTSLALQGLVAQGALTPVVEALGLGFLTTGQDADAGWSYYANTVATPGVSDPDSTALVIQALVAMGDSPAAAMFTKGGATPVSTLLSFQLTSAPDAGAFYFPPALTPDILATYEPVPALAGLPFGWGPSGNGYWEVASDGGIFNFGAAASFLGSAGEIHLNAPVVGLASTSSGGGYWEVASDGGIFTYGDADFYGSMGGKPLNKPVVGIAATPDGRGYWEVASDGGIFSFGDAAFYGSMGGKPLNKPVVGITATPDGLGYWEVASDGGIFSFGDAAFYGSMGGKPLNKPVVGITATPDGLGYWEVASDGGIFSFGDAAFFGSMGGKPLNKPVVGIAATPDGLGYWEVASDGGVFNFGDAAFLGSTGSIALNAPVVGISASPARPT